MKMVRIMKAVRYKNMHDATTFTIANEALTV